MKHIHHLRARWLFAAMVVAVVVGEVIAAYVSKAFDLRCPTIAVAAICVGVVAGGVSWLYDGRE